MALLRRQELPGGFQTSSSFFFCVASAFLLLLLSSPLPTSAKPPGAMSQSQLSQMQFASSASSKNSPRGLQEAQPCPRGTYRSAGLQETECKECPRGRYGTTEGLVAER